MPSPRWQLNDATWLRQEYVERGRTGRDVAAEIGVHPNTLAKALERHGIHKTQHRTMATVPAKWLRQQHVRRKRSTRDIAAELGVSPRSVQRALTAAGIPINDSRLPPELDDPDWMAAHDSLTRAEIAALLDCSREAVTTARRRHGLREPLGAVYAKLDDRSWLERRYHDDGWSQQRIADEIGCSRTAVTQAMKRLGIPARPPRTPQHHQLSDAAWLASQVKAGRSHAQIAEEVGCHRTSVADALRRHGLVSA